MKFLGTPENGTPNLDKYCKYKDGLQNQITL